MSDTIAKGGSNNITNGNGVPDKAVNKDRDVERGEEKKTSRERNNRRASTVTAETVSSVLENELEGGTANSNSTVLPGPVPRGRGRLQTVARLLRNLFIAMLLLAFVAALLALVWIFMGPMFVLQLGLVALVAYFVAGGRLRWFYVALRTAPRDLRALIRYARLLLTIKGHEKKNRSVADIFQQHVARHPNKPCLICEDKEWSFQEVEDFSNRIATVFKNHGYRKGDTVALLMENKPEYVATWIGLSKLGIIVPLINTNLRKSTLLHSLNVANCQALIYGSELSEAIKDIASSLNAKLALYRYGNELESNSSGLKEKDLTSMLAEATAVPPVIQEKGNYCDKLIYIYTSGTTGLPKAAVITNSRFMFIASAIHYLAAFRDNDRFYTPLPLYHTAGGIMSVGQALLHGSTVVIRKKFSASSYFPDCVKYKCTVAQYIGEMCRYILASPVKPESTQHNLRLIFGNGLRPQIWREFVDRFKIPNVAEFYGATEGNANIVNVDNTVGAIGFISRIISAIYPISIIRVNADGEPIRNSKGLCQVCKPDEPGVFIGKIIRNNPARAFLGYVDEKASKSKIVYDVFTHGDSAFLSGDILVSDELGYLYFKDRTGDTFRWKGENVSTTEIEAVVSNLVNYRDCIVYGVEIRGSEGRAGMAAIYDEDSSVDMNRLSSMIREQLPSYARPLFVRTLTKIDMTGTFKLKKKDLQEEAYDPRKITDKLYYLDPKLGYQLLTPEIYDQIQAGKIRF
ncbi:long-chain fatty acid transport protein 4 isoform X2 [Venturia canescens]|uniref:long-chain fatty acid transport protein 4 isoform X2 n=1 Tax=Venturia canescens TaxID=32260 RepID=UPI001C9C871E|nr:long-chain fatty acid transport protein 4 isoform X2 [Venturia canescens]XP_043274833.1 long-chain fatty acid transport protein 4 isoform X2 [Venturia canescens]